MLKKGVPNLVKHEGSISCSHSKVTFPGKFNGIAEGFNFGEFTDDKL